MQENVANPSNTHSSTSSSDVSSGSNSTSATDSDMNVAVPPPSPVIQFTYDFYPLREGPLRGAEGIVLDSPLSIPRSHFKVIPTYSGALEKSYILHKYERQTDTEVEASGTVQLTNIQWVTQCYTFPFDQEESPFPFLRKCICTYEIMGQDTNNDLYVLTNYYMNSDKHVQLSRATMYGYNYARLRKIIGLRMLIEPFLRTPALTKFHPDPFVDQQFRAACDELHHTQTG